MTFLEKLLPAQADNNYRGHPVAFWGMWLLMLPYTFRSLVHFLKDDSGANSIASIHLFPVGDTDPNQIIHMFSSLWGGQQLLMVMLYVVVLLRYRNLLSLMWLTVLIEIVFRFVTGEMHPLTPEYYQRTPPGKW